VTLVLFRHQGASVKGLPKRIGTGGFTKNICEGRVKSGVAEAADTRKYFAWEYTKQQTNFNVPIGTTS
jgi:hypothetical protein